MKIRVAMNAASNYLRRSATFLFRTIEFVLLWIVSWALCAQLLPFWKINSDFSSQQNGVEIFIRSNGVHTDFVLPIKSTEIRWDTLFPFDSFPRVDSTFSHVAFGWGDKGFFLNTPTWNDLTFSTAFSAAFGLGESAMHVSYIRNNPVPGRKCRSFTISNKQYQLLINYVRNGFRFEQNEIVMIDNPGYGTNDRFYEGNNTYNLFNTCNEWTGDGMEVTGLPVGIWTPLEPGVMN